LSGARSKAGGWAPVRFALSVALQSDRLELAEAAAGAALQG
jgi:hypothetical protein